MSQKCYLNFDNDRSCFYPTILTASAFYNVFLRYDRQAMATSLITRLRGIRHTQLAN
jgi:hypothetical protein